MSKVTEEIISVVIPVYNEGEAIRQCLTGLYAALQAHEHELLICYDFDEDNTLPAIDAIKGEIPTIRLVKNLFGRGVAKAIKSGFDSARGDVIVTFMADMSDSPEIILQMAEKMRTAGAHIVSGSRYMKGGKQIGGPLLKRTLSRVAGLSLFHLAGIPTHDPTTNFRAYSRDVLDNIEIESDEGFDIALELTVKAFIDGYKIDEVPSTWTDRTSGESQFKLFKWLPNYLKWYFMAVTKNR